MLKGIASLPLGLRCFYLHSHTGASKVIHKVTVLGDFICSWVCFKLRKGLFSAFWVAFSAWAWHTGHLDKGKVTYAEERDATDQENGGTQPKNAGEVEI